MMGKLLSQMTLSEIHVETDVIHAHLTSIAAGRNALLFAAATGRFIGESVADVDSFMDTMVANAAKYALCSCGSCHN